MCVLRPTVEGPRFRAVLHGVDLLCVSGKPSRLVFVFKSRRTVLFSRRGLQFLSRRGLFV